MAADRQWRTVAPEVLLADPERYSFSAPLLAEQRSLESSLERCGMLRPLLCCVAGDGAQLHLISGHRRLKWAVEQGVDGVPVWVTEGETGPRLWDVLLADAQDHRPLNPVERGLYLLRRCASTGESMDDLAAGVFPALGMPPRAAAAEDLLWVCGLPPTARQGFADGSRPLHAARYLRRAAREDALTILHACAGLAGGVNKFTELVRLLLECTWRAGTTTREWMHREGLDRHWENLDEFRHAVRRLRYPRLSHWEEEFSNAVGRAGLSSLVDVQPPRGFEGDRYQCRVTFRSVQELGQALRETLARLEEGRLDSLAEFLE